MSKRTREHEIDTQAKIQLEKLLFPWVIQELKPDYGEDYRIIVFENQLKTNISTIVQLKGSTSLKWNKNKDFLSFSLRKKDLEDYLNSRESIFLVVIDVKSKKGYYLFIQEYIDNYMSDGQWKSKKKPTVRIPANNLLANKALFQESIKKAQEYMAAKFPASIETSILAEKRRIQNLDSRFDIKITATNEAIHKEIVPLQEAKLTLTFKNIKNEKTNSKYQQLIEQGHDVNFSEDEISIDGSPLLSEFNGHPCRIKISKSKPANLIWTITDMHNKPIRKIDGFLGTVTAGTKEWHYNGELPGGVLKISLSGKLNENEGGSLTFGFDLTPWEGQPIQALKSFDAILNIFNPESESLSHSIELYLNGIARPLKVTPYYENMSMKEFIDYFLLIEKARKISNRYNIYPLFSLEEDNRRLDEIERLYSLLNGEILQRNAPDLKITITVLNDSRITPSDLLNPSPISVKGTRRFHIFNEIIEIENHEYILDNMLLTNEPKELLEKLKHTSKEIQLEFKGTQNTIISEKIDPISLPKNHPSVRAQISPSA